MGLHSGATWRTRLNDPWVASMRRCVKLLWSIVEERTDCIHYVGALTVPERGLGRGLGRSPSGNRIWRILASNSDIWWHEIYKFSNFSENQVTTMYAFFYLIVCSFHVRESWHDVNILIILVVKLLVRHPPGLRTCSYARDFSNKLINQSINIRLLRHDKMQANTPKQKGNTVTRKKTNLEKISQRTEPNMCSYITYAC